jgi:hypothetical protein
MPTLAAVMAGAMMTSPALAQGTVVFSAEQMADHDATVRNLTSSDDNAREAEGERLHR